MVSLTLRVCNGLLSLLISSFLPPESQCPVAIVEMMKMDCYKEYPDDVFTFHRFFRDLMCDGILNRISLLIGPVWPLFVSSKLKGDPLIRTKSCNFCFHLFISIWRVQIVLKKDTVKKKTDILGKCLFYVKVYIDN